jgi:DNA-directed RNA polymerase subunit RPC12/RpoP
MLGLIIFGSRSVTGSKGTGTFDCPRCGGDTPYDHKRVRRFFTLYFIPLIPMGTLGEYIECERCGGTYKPEVLHRMRPPAV